MVVSGGKGGDGEIGGDGALPTRRQAAAKRQALGLRPAGANGQGAGMGQAAKPAMTHTAQRLRAAPCPPYLGPCPRPGRARWRVAARAACGRALRGLGGRRGPPPLPG